MINFDWGCVMRRNSLVFILAVVLIWTVSSRAGAQIESLTETIGEAVQIVRELASSIGETTSIIVMRVEQRARREAAIKLRQLAHEIADIRAVKGQYVIEEVIELGGVSLEQAKSQWQHIGWNAGIGVRRLGNVISSIRQHEENPILDSNQYGELLTALIGRQRAYRKFVTPPANDAELAKLIELARSIRVLDMELNQLTRALDGVAKALVSDGYAPATDGKREQLWSDEPIGKAIETLVKALGFGLLVFLLLRFITQRHRSGR